MVLYNHELVFHTLQSPLKPALSLGPLGEAQREKMMETVSDFLDGLPTIVSLERKREDGLKNKSTLSEVDDKKKKEGIPTTWKRSSACNCHCQSRVCVLNRHSVVTVKSARRLERYGKVYSVSVYITQMCCK